MPFLEAWPRSRAEVALGEDTRAGARSCGHASWMAAGVLRSQRSRQQVATLAATHEPSDKAPRRRNNGITLFLWSSEGPGVNSEYLQCTLERKAMSEGSPLPIIAEWEMATG